MDNIDKSLAAGRDLLDNLSVETASEWYKGLEFLINYVDLTRHLMDGAVVFRHDSSQSLSSIKCQQCKTDYWINCGDLSDMTAYEPDCYRCPHCENVDVITDKVIQNEPVDLELAEDGFKTPNEAIGL